mmetsp:Transcript_3985/g.4514  ORF Transcript_3985/g.4514 Transcript_3985/m.4514 type:complete len:415 (-) Transcript_3985:75-1319(-)
MWSTRVSRAVARLVCQRTASTQLVKFTKAQENVHRIRSVSRNTQFDNFSHTSVFTQLRNISGSRYFSTEEPGDKESATEEKLDESIGEDDEEEELEELDFDDEVWDDIKEEFAQLDLDSVNIDEYISMLTKRLQDASPQVEEDAEEEEEEEEEEEDIEALMKRANYVANEKFLWPETERGVKTLRTAMRKLPRDVRPNYAVEFERESEQWPSAQEILGKDFNYIYDVRSLFEDSMFKGPVTKIKAPPSFSTREDPVPYEGATPFLNWEVNLVLSVGPSQYHPENCKVKLWFYVEDLKKNYNLTDAAVTRIQMLCQKRYKPAKRDKKGSIVRPAHIVLMGDKYPQREDNRRLVYSWLMELVREGQLAGTDQDPLLPAYEERDRILAAQAEEDAKCIDITPEDTIILKSQDLSGWA